MGNVIPAAPKPVTLAVESRRTTGYVFIAATRNAAGWTAVTSDYTGPTSPSGFGPTSEQAIDSLLTQLIKRGEI